MSNSHHQNIFLSFCCCEYDSLSHNRACTINASSYLHTDELHLSLQGLHREIKATFLQPRGLNLLKWQLCALGAKDARHVYKIVTSSKN